MAAGAGVHLYSVRATREGGGVSVMELGRAASNRLPVYENGIDPDRGAAAAIRDGIPLPELARVGDREVEDDDRGESRDHFLGGLTMDTRATTFEAISRILSRSPPIFTKA